MSSDTEITAVEKPFLTEANLAGDSRSLFNLWMGQQKVRHSLTELEDAELLYQIGKVLSVFALVVSVIVFAIVQTLGTGAFLAFGVGGILYLGYGRNKWDRLVAYYDLRNDVEALKTAARGIESPWARESGEGISSTVWKMLVVDFVTHILSEIRKEEFALIAQMYALEGHLVNDPDRFCKVHRDTLHRIEEVSSALLKFGIDFRTDQDQFSRVVDLVRTGRAAEHHLLWS